MAEATASETTKEIRELTPATKVCFAVQAVRGNGKVPGPFSAKECAETLRRTVDRQPVTDRRRADVRTGLSVARGRGALRAVARRCPGRQPPRVDRPALPRRPVDPYPPVATPTVGDTTPNSGFKGKWFAIGVWPVNGTLNDPDTKLDELKKLDQRARLSKSTVYAAMEPPIPKESWLLYLGPFDDRADALAACKTVDEVLPLSCAPGQLDP